MCETFKSKLCVANILDECVVEFPDQGSVVDECAEGSVVVERKLEVLGSPDEMEQVKLPVECTVVVVTEVLEKHVVVVAEWLWLQSLLI